MIRGLWTAASGMNAQQLSIDVCANNLANANTSGFKKSRNNFQDLMYQTLQIPGADAAGGGQVPTGIQIGMGARPVSVQKIFTQGDFEQTGNELDMAIEGNGFFKVVSGEEELYTRSGNFTRDSEGFLTTSSGERLQPEISVPEGTTQITIQPNGQLTAYGSGNVALATADIVIHSFMNPGGLYAVGRNLLRPTAASGEAVEGVPGTEGFGTIASGTLEMSNVSVVEEMVALIVGQRAYEANSKALQTADTLLQTANGIKR
ncbi:MAG: flagellar basal-body rod protein FlgG [Pseudomonadota bacterium]